MYRSLGEYRKFKAEEYWIVIRKEIGDRKGEVACYVNLGDVYGSLGKYDEAERYPKEALVITKEIGDRKRRSCMLY